MEDTKSKKQSETRSEKGKGISLQVWRGPGGSRRLRIPDFKTIGT